MRKTGASEVCTHCDVVRDNAERGGFNALNTGQRPGDSVDTDALRKTGASEDNKKSWSKHNALTSSFDTFPIFSYSASDKEMQELLVQAML